MESTLTVRSEKGALDINTLEDWLWKAACSIRGPIDAPKFKDYILPLIFLKRLSDVYDDELAELSKKFGDEKTALELVKTDHTLVRFFIPDDARWSKIKKITRNIGEQLTDVIRSVTKENKLLGGVIDIVDYNASISGQRIIDDGRLSNLVVILSDVRYRLGLNDVEPDILGRSYEYLLRKFAEGQGQSAGEFFTPKEVGWLIAYLLNPQQGQTVYDPACGSGGLLIKCQLALKENLKKIEKPLQLFGQEINHFTFAISKMNMIIHDMEGQIEIGDSFRNPKFLKDSSLKDDFDFVVANPMWNQDGYDENFYDSDPFSRFEDGHAPANSADWGWIQHMLASINDEGKIAVVLDTGSVSRGSGAEGNHRERDIRKAIIEKDFIEGIILLPENLFYNTTSPGIILLLNKKKNEQQKDKVIVINASKFFKKGTPKNFIPEEKIKDITDYFHKAEDVENYVKIVTKDEIVKKNYNLYPSLYTGVIDTLTFRDIPTLLEEFHELEKENFRIKESLKNIFPSLKDKEISEIANSPKRSEENKNVK